MVDSGLEPAELAFVVFVLYSLHRPIFNAICIRCTFTIVMCKYAHARALFGALAS